MTTARELPELFVVGFNREIAEKLDDNLLDRLVLRFGFFVCAFGNSIIDRDREFHEPIIGAAKSPTFAGGPEKWGESFWPRNSYAPVG